MNSHRDNIKDTIRNCLDSIGIDNDVDELVYVFADAVFEALGITEDEQDKAGGYWMLHAGIKAEKVCVSCKQIITGDDIKSMFDGICNDCLIKGQVEDKGYDKAIESQTGDEGRSNDVD